MRRTAPALLVLSIAVSACRKDAESPAAPFAAVNPKVPEAIATAAIARPRIELSITNVTTGQPIANGETVPAGHQFQVTVTTSDADCAGQFVVSALGAPGFPPSVFVQLTPFIIGPAVGSNTASGAVLTANPLGSSVNDWKVSASCNGVSKGYFDFDRFEFFAAP